MGRDHDGRAITDAGGERVTDLEHRCVLCAARGRTTRLESGHCCVPCGGRLSETIADIARLAADAAA
jgi:hypothetical protein